MSTPWLKRKARLDVLLKTSGDEDAAGLALDRILHGQNAIGKTVKTTEIDSLRFQDADLQVVGALERGQFGLVDVVKCHLDGRMYVRKSVEKRFALRAREQCSPQFERDILLRARTTESIWAPHLLCAFHTPTHLNLVMDYAEGGTLWDVLESHPQGRVSEEDMAWWTPQAISAVNWCHSQGFAHRDIKPHNFVLTPDARVLLIDFGSAAPIEGGRLPKQYCLVPCGTCDYISPEILSAHEQALVALEMEDTQAPDELYGYGCETDWWSLGAMLYEMVYGVAPFFATDIGKTYLRIMAHEKSLRFDASIPVSAAFQDLLRRFLTHAERRLGRRGIHEILDHPAFVEVNWTMLSSEPPPPDLHLPQFTYAEPSFPPTVDDSHSHSQPFAFSALFQSSAVTSPGASVLHANVDATPLRGSRSLSPADDAFIGFSWGPPEDAFPQLPGGGSPGLAHAGMATPQPARLAIPRATPTPRPHHLGKPGFHSYPFMTPIRRSAGDHASTARRRPVSDREAMKQLADCIGMSARKKVFESGRKPRVLPSFSSQKTLPFLPAVAVPDFASSSQGRLRPARAVPVSEGEGTGTESESEGPPSPSPSPRPGSAMSRRSGTPTITGTYSRSGLLGGTSVSLSLPRIGIGRRPESGLGQGGDTPPVVTSPSFEDRTFDALEDTHAAMMEEIGRLEDRLGRFAVRVGRGR
ncbi:kinase-like domain-containing protein [Mycena maculata]|uniref:non-specific serine/threonine protein kinase n=1 Tax=Mycena maculata TaxID=230809 RepID=A0AAD7NNT5_9AGAR|nr:kinase-like domain-containing protein [Mycena maculata]